ncbi:GMC oxidoreductase [Bradyrhizobium sp. ARR65]|uniref:GMC oxidoreductase n=1 Tax=Bradyrhizobium sp. ARR65 TaxID=1040989 RepID=UPI0009FBDEDD|nr:GMC oxidoreductase [Bradyrhizobium sp. ARR65]
MFRSFADLASLANCDACIVGGGPAGIAVALACEERGLSVLLLESGKDRVDGFYAGLSTGHDIDLETHAAPHVAICRALGGASKWWGGRCTPLDEIDFAKRAFVDSNWPISHTELAICYDKAAEFFGIAPADFISPVQPWGRLESVRFEDLERWTPERDVSKRHRDRLAKSKGIALIAETTLTEIHVSEDARHVSRLTVRSQEKSTTISPKYIVLACGGLETTRLLLWTQSRLPKLFGGVDGPLGRYYSGHLSGKIANLVLVDPAHFPAHDYFLDSGVFVRRRFTFPPEVQRREELLNIALYADNPPFHSADHRIGILSLAWLALATPILGRFLAPEGIRISHLGPLPYRWSQHLRNVVSQPLATCVSILSILNQRYFSVPKKPGFLLYNARGRYALHYHAEQSPSPQSRVTLSSKFDAFGLPYLNVRLRFSEADARSVVRAHSILDTALRQSGLGYLEFGETEAESRVQYVLRHAKDGFHQIGTTRMGFDPQQSIVNADCRTHDLENLYIASSSVFSSPGQASPTFPTVALGFRLSAHLASQIARERFAASHKRRLAP